MLSKFQNFITKHKKKFLYGGIFMVAGYGALKYAQRKLVEYQERVSFNYFLVPNKFFELCPLTFCIYNFTININNNETNCFFELINLASQRVFRENKAITTF